jgi:hypothetical protein
MIATATCPYAVCQPGTRQRPSRATERALAPERRGAPDRDGLKTGTPGRQRPSPWRRWLGRAGLLLLAGYLLFSHGCHGDEDNELFAPAVRYWGRGIFIGRGWAKSWPSC